MSEPNWMAALPSSNEGGAWHCSRSIQTGMGREGTRLILWREMWPRLSAAKRHGYSQIVTVFLERLFEEAVFDDEGAWIVKPDSIGWPPPAETEERTESNLPH